MTPFAAWVQSKAEVHVFASSDDAPFSAEEKDQSLHDEIGGLEEAIVDNLMASSKAQLRSTLALMEQRLEKKRQENQDSYLRAELSKIEERTTTMVADALVPVLSELQRSRIVNEFASILKRILPEFAQQRLTIDAPDDVHDRLSSALKVQSIEADLASSQDRQITIAGSNVVLRADLEQWVRRLSEAAAA